VGKESTGLQRGWTGLERLGEPQGGCDTSIMSEVYLKAKG
jgi:hypothetical protein